MSDFSEKPYIPIDVNAIMDTVANYQKILTDDAENNYGPDQVRQMMRHLDRVWPYMFYSCLVSGKGVRAHVKNGAIESAVPYDSIALTPAISNGFEYIPATLIDSNGQRRETYRIGYYFTDRHIHTPGFDPDILLIDTTAAQIIPVMPLRTVQ